MDESGYRLEICQRHELCLHQLKHLLKKVCVRCFYQSSIESYYTKTQSTQINQHLSCTLPQTTHLGSQPETTTGTQKEQTMQDILKTLTPRELWQAVALGRQAGGHHRSIKELLYERPQRVSTLPFAFIDVYELKAQLQKSNSLTARYNYSYCVSPFGSTLV